MCGRYFVDRAESPEDLARIIDALNRKGQIVKTGEIFPSDPVPVIANSRAMQPAAFAMSWGYQIPGGSLIINARSESAEENRCSGMAWPSAAARYLPPTISSGSAPGSRKRSMLYARQAMASCTWPVSIAWKMVGQYSRY